MRMRRALIVVALASTLLAAACSSNGGTKNAVSAATTGAPGTGGSAIGFIFVGPKDDFGYNQAAYEGSQEVAKANPSLKVVTAENVPEDASAERVMNDMITKDNAKIIFATSYGHYDAAEAVAKAHPDVVVVHQGGLVKNK